jgi:hypothetical protein
LNRPAAAELIRELRQAGAVFEARGDRLRVEAPVGVLQPEVEDQLREQKPAIIALLRGPYPCESCARFAFPEPGMVCYWCRSAHEVSA